MYDAPECWERYDDKSLRCLGCEVSESCALCTVSAKKMDTPLGGQDFDEVAEWAPDLADYDHTPGDESEPKHDSAATHSDLAGFLRFLLFLDDYTLGVLAEIIAPSRDGSRPSVSDLARVRGISRQGMHRKTLDMARKSPELASLLSMTVKKIQKCRREFARPQAHENENNGQMEFHF